MKKKKWFILIPITLVLLVCAVFFVINIIEVRRTVPYIAFMQNSTRTNCLYICSNGDIYAATSEESFVMDFPELIECIKEKEYADILEYVGSTNRWEVQKMHRLFREVVVNEEYRVYPRRPDGPSADEYGGSEGYWGGIYYDDGIPKYKEIYTSNADMLCTDERAYEIVDWMYDCLKDYMK